MKTFRRNPDMIALAILGLLFLAPSVLALHAPRPHPAFNLSPVSWGDRELSGDPAQIKGLEDIVDWTNNLERRGERVWERLADRMRRFEQRFDKFSQVPPRSRSVYCEADSE